jgi:hypothetical protein
MYTTNQPTLMPLFPCGKVPLSLSNGMPMRQTVCRASKTPPKTHCVIDPLAFVLCACTVIHLLLTCHWTHMFLTFLGICIKTYVANDRIGSGEKGDADVNLLSICTLRICTLYNLLVFQTFHICQHLYGIQSKKCITHTYTLLYL